VTCIGIFAFQKVRLLNDMHRDICFPKGAPVEATSLILIDENDKRTELINNDGLRFDLLE